MDRLEELYHAERIGLKIEQMIEGGWEEVRGKFYPQRHLNYYRVVHNNDFFVHEDIYILRDRIPVAYYLEADKYIMQEDRIVFIGGVDDCLSFMDRNKGKRCEESKTLSLPRKKFAYEIWEEDAEAKYGFHKNHGEGVTKYGK